MYIAIWKTRLHGYIVYRNPKTKIMNENKNIDSVDVIAREFKSLFPGLTSYEALLLAIQFQRNQILNAGPMLQTTEGPLTLEVLIMQLRKKVSVTDNQSTK